MSAKKQNLVDLDSGEKSRITKVSVVTLALVAIVCCILVGCFACSQNIGLPSTEMSDEQKITYWRAMAGDTTWEPTGEGTFGRFFSIPMKAKTSYDANSGEFIIHFMMSDDSPLDTAIINLTSEFGEIVFQDEEKWSIKFSEKNDELFMTINDKADGSGVTVYYEDV